VTAIAIFVKTPGHSPIKTRLAASVGREKAEHWHRLASRVVAERALEADIGPVYFAVAEDLALSHPLWSRLPTIGQGFGGLGERMHHVHSRLLPEHGSTLLLGADTIQWPLDSLRLASQWLNNPAARLCIGPARDGGFWTVGSNRALPLSAWARVNYSRETTLRDFTEAMAAHGRFKTLSTLTDLDDLSDVVHLLSECPDEPLSRSFSECIEFLTDKLAQ